MALVPTSNNQIIAVPIKSLQTNCSSKIQFTSTSSLLHPQISTSSTAASKTITLPSSIKTVAGLKSLPSSLKVPNNLLTSFKKNDAKPSSELKTATYLICPKNSLLNDLNKTNEQLVKDNQIIKHNQLDLNKSNNQSNLINQPQINHIIQPVSQPSTKIITQPINQIIISQPNRLLIKQTNQESNSLILTNQSSDQTNDKMEVEYQTKTRLMSQLEPICEENEESNSRGAEMDTNQLNKEQSSRNNLNNDSNENKSNELNNEFNLDKIDDEIMDDYDLLSSPDGSFDAIDCLIWENDIGLLPGTNLQFKINEYDCLELVNDKEADELRKNHTRFYDKYIDTSHLSNGLTCSNDESYSICSTCGIKKLKSSFIRKGRFCSQECATLQSSQLRNFKKSNILDSQIQDRFNLNSKLDLGSYRKHLRSRKPNSDKFEQDTFFLNGHEEVVDDFKTKVKENYNQEKYFSWKNYLIETRSIAAPLKCFKPHQIFNESIKNSFKKGMKLEAIDPLHPSLFCVATVVEVCGFRIRVHLDKYSDQFDFWVNCDSPFIFYVGFCAKTDRKLQPPKNYKQFDWSTYLQQEKAKAAPKHCFYWYNKQVQIPAGFKKGMKLEAVDKANSSLVCVATINDVLGEWLLIHFDGWDYSYDYWTEYNSPHIHPTNWCKAKGKPLTPPKDYQSKSTEKFSWLEYLEETHSTCVPSSSFRVRSPNLFKTSMKLEVVDRKNPRCIRVATIIARNAYSIKINFDNWDEKYDFWIDDDSPDIHPINYCYHTNHYLEEPPSYDYDSTSYYNRCPIFGCKGIGHVGYSNLLDHDSVDDCPYSEENIDYEVPDRFGDSSELSSENYNYMNEDEQMLSNLPSPNSDSISLSTIDKMNYTNRLSNNKITKNMYNSYTLECFDNYYSDSEQLSRSSSPNSDLNILPIRQSIIDIKTSFLQLEEPLPHFDKNTKHLLSYVNQFKAEEVLEWNCDRVSNFISTLPGCFEYAQQFKDENVDGEAFLLLTQTDLIKIMNVKLGPSVKIYNTICQIRKNLTN